MCRIAGIASQSLTIEEMQDTVAFMCYVQRHGGPDAEGMYASLRHNLVLGHRRLSLLDLETTGRQPMHYLDGRYTISFNGEIYNYRELKEELHTLGYTFASTSDTEVILAAFAAWGTASFARLNGMFAFALFDTTNGELFLVRDVMGIKPLYFTIQKDTLVFASEVRAFSQLQKPLEEHPHWPVYLMAYGHLPEPVTTLRAVRPLRKGTYLTFNTRTGKGTTTCFEHLSFFEKDEDRNHTIQQVQTTLQAAVKQHLIADAPIGTFLSGGIDSSIIAVLAGKIIGEKQNTLSLFFEEKNFSEKAYQDEVRRRLSSVHHQHLLTKDEFHLNLPEIIEAMDLPSSDGINTWFISRTAKDAGLKAVLSGLGGDELFGGYPSFQRSAVTAMLQGLPQAALKVSRFTKAKHLRRLVYLSLDGAKGQYLFLRGLFVPQSIAGFLDMDEAEVWHVLEEEPVLPDISYLTAGNRASWMELNLYMQNQLLRDADVMSMAHGVEIRVPFLDKSFVRLALSLSSKEKYTGAFGKQLLIDAFRSELPVDVWQRKKMGFSFPFSDWLSENEWVRSKMMSGGKASLAIMDRFHKGTLHWSGLITALLLRTYQYETKPAFLNT